MTIVKVGIAKKYLLVITFSTSVGRKVSRGPRLKDSFGFRPSAVDVYSRVLFPSSFALFHLSYWAYCFYNVKPIPDGIILLKRDY